MINFIQPNEENNNFKVYLLTPGNQERGELLVKNPVLDLQLQGLSSSFSFQMEEMINNKLNPRINEVLNQFIIEVWYGNGTTQSYQTQKFIVIETPQQLTQNDATIFEYIAYSREHENKFKKIIKWPGIKIQEFKDTTTQVFDLKELQDAEADFNHTMTIAHTPKDDRLVRVNIMKNYIYRLPIVKTTESYIFSEPNVTVEAVKVNGTNQSLTKGEDDQNGYNTTDVDGVITVTFAIEGDFIPGVDTVYIEYRAQPIPVPLMNIDDSDKAKNDIYKFYISGKSLTVTLPGNTPILAIGGIGLESTLSASGNHEMYYEVYYETNDSLTDPEKLMLVDKYVKDGLELSQILSSLLTYGNPDSTNGKWQAVVEDSLVGELRSGFEFNNTNLLDAIRLLAQTFDAIVIPDTFTKKLYFFKKNETGKQIDNIQYGVDYGLTIEQGKYLKTASSSIQTNEIVTVMRGIGSNNITMTGITPSGENEWENYDYYYDGAAITNLSDIITNSSDPINLNKSSRWMSTRLLEKLLLWQHIRDTYVSDELYGTNGLVIRQDILYKEYTRKEIERVILETEMKVAQSLHDAFEGYTPEEKEKELKNYVYTDQTTDENYTNSEGYLKHLEDERDKTITSHANKQAEIALLFNNPGEIVIGVKEVHVSDRGNLGIDQIQTRLTYIFKNFKKHTFIEFFNNSEYENDSLSIKNEDYNFDGDDYTELAAFRREGIYNNEFINNAYDLFKEVKKEILNRNLPEVTILANIIDIFKAFQAEKDRDKLILGSLVNIFIPRLNINRQIQIKSITIAPDSNSSSITFSTQKDYLGIGSPLLGKILRHTEYNIKDKLAFNNGKWNVGSIDAEKATKKLDGTIELINNEITSSNGSQSASAAIINNEGTVYKKTGINVTNGTIIDEKSDIFKQILTKTRSLIKMSNGRILLVEEDIQTGQLKTTVAITSNGIQIGSLPEASFGVRYYSGAGDPNVRPVEYDYRLSSQYGYRLNDVYKDTDDDNQEWLCTTAGTYADSIWTEISYGGTLINDLGIINSVTMNSKQILTSMGSGSFKIRNDTDAIDLFYIDSSGNAVFSGELKAATGEIGGWDIYTSALQSTNFTGFGGDGQNTSAGLRIHSDGWISAPKFNLSSAGILTATDVNLTGKITANSGSFGNWTVETGAIKRTLDEANEVFMSWSDDIGLGSPINNGRPGFLIYDNIEDIADPGTYLSYISSLSAKAFSAMTPDDYPYQMIGNFKFDDHPINSLGEGFITGKVIGNTLYLFTNDTTTRG